MGGVFPWIPRRQKEEGVRLPTFIEKVNDTKLRQPVVTMLHTRARERAIRSHVSPSWLRAV